MPLTDDEREYIKQIVEETLIQAGIDHEHPLESQADFRFLRQMREGCEKVASKVVMAVIGVLLTAAVSLIGFQVGKKALGG